MSQRRSFGTILVVDDKERNIEVIGTTLAAIGYEIIPATSGEQALARIEARPPDLILLDILMPGMDGFEVCRRLQADPVYAAIPLIFVSAAYEKNVIVEALEVGGVDYITKPFNKPELCARVKTHLELKRARDQLHRLAEEREEFIGMLAHDLKNPLFISAQMLNRKAHELSAGAADSAARIQEGTERAFKFVDEFLLRTASDRIEAPVRMVEVDLGECVDSILRNHIDHAVRKDITIHWQKPESARTVRSDPSALSDAQENLVSNAIKFSTLGSSVWVSLDPELPSIRVCDEGPGFTEEDKAKLYNRFVRLSAKPTGSETSTGLGLSIAKKLVEQIGGELNCESEAGRGAKFTVALPSELLPA